MEEIRTIAAAKKALREKKITSVELTTEYLRRIDERDAAIGAFLHVDPAGALAQARAADEYLNRDDSPEDLAGIPLAIKDNILIEGLPATAGSKILEHYTAEYDAGVIKRLKERNAIFLGKTNLDEFAMGSSTENSALKKTVNPLDETRVPGGSSGGSAASVAAGFASGAFGSDTGGSIRQPAAFCGVVGLKTTYGSVSRSGLIALASSLDQIGPFAMTSEDAALLFDGVKGPDPLDATSVPEAIYKENESFASLDVKKARSFTVGVPEEFFKDGLDPHVAKKLDEAMTRLKHLGVSFKSIALPHARYALSCYYIILPAEVSSNLARFDGVRYARLPGLPYQNLLELYENQRGAGFGPETKRRLILGTFVLSSGYYDAYYAKAQKVRTLILRDFENAFKEVDVIFAPTTPTPAFKRGEKSGDPLAMYLSDIFTIPVNLAGLPAVSIPVDSPLTHRFTPDNLPVGFQLIGRHFREFDILSLGHAYEQG